MTATLLIAGVGLELASILITAYWLSKRMVRRELLQRRLAQR